MIEELCHTNEALLTACEVMLTDVAAYRNRGGTLTDKEAAHVEAMQAAVDKAKGS